MLWRGGALVGKVGDLLSVPASFGRVAVAKVIYVSTSFKNLMGIRVLRQAFAEAPSPDALPRGLEYFSDVMYTGTQSVGTHWKLLGNVGCTDQEVELTKRLVGTNVYIGDQNLGRASESDFKTLRSMAVLNMYGVQDVVTEKLAKQ